MTHRSRMALAGAGAAAVALGVGELTGGLLSGAPSPIAAVGAVVIDLQPPGAKDLMIALFGQADKLAFEIVIAVAALAIGAVLGLLARRWPFVPAVGLLGFAGVGLVASLRDPLVAPLLAGITLLVAVAAGLVAYAALSSAARGRGARPAWEAGDGAAADAEDPEVVSGTRRRFLAYAASAFGLAALGVAGGRHLVERRPALRPAIAIPPAGEPVAAVPPGASFDIPGLTPIVVPNRDFYRIDTRLTIPRLDADTWRLRVHGMVEQEVELTYADLVRLPLIERYVTIACVSNEVGGGLVGNAKWTGVALQRVLDMAGVQPGATQIVPRSFDGWTAGFPTAFGGADGQEALIALQMNDEPLPPDHGYPARLIVPGLYGYVSATKWLTEIELTTLEAFDAYWVPLGWAKEAPVKTQSRIDVPRSGARLPPGRVVIAGVAWAPDRGVAGVEVAVDGGAWQAATVSQPLSQDTWVQWKLDWDAPAGEHELSVRATDGTGAVQTAERRPPAPDGATGHHTIRVSVG